MSSKLPPGPWDARGNKVTVNGQTVAVVFYPRNASEIAAEIANLPELIDEVESLRDQVEEYGQKDVRDE